MRILPFAMGALLLAIPAKADKFWFADPAGQKAAEGSRPDCLHGVLLAEDADHYHVRVVGGEVLVAKKTVFRVEKDSLTIEQVVQAEQQEAERAAAARSLRAAAEGRSRRLPGRLVEASARRGEATPAAAPAPAARPVFDPVIGRALPGVEAMSDAELQRDLQLAWSLTKDRRYLAALRQLRRAH